MKAETHKTTIVHLMFSDFVWESRVLRQAQAALDAGLAERIELIGYMDTGLKPFELINSQIDITRLAVPALRFMPRLPRRILQWVYWSFAAARSVQRNSVALVQAHSLAAMPAGCIAKNKAATRLIYDCHELESERAGWGVIQKKGARIIERIVLGFADETLVVGRLIQQWYQSHYGIKSAVIRNLPALPKQNLNAAQSGTNSLRQAAKIADGHLIFVYLGAIGDGRGVHLLIDAFKQLPANKHVVFLGRGELVEAIVRASKSHENIHWLPPVASNEVVRFIKSADVGLSIIEDISLSYRYCLPNKLFESRHAGLPVLVSDLPEMAAYLEEYGGGWKTNLNVESIRDAILKIDEQAISKITSTATPPPSWETEALTYCSVLRSVLAMRV
jgi:glycosyltransferase involved in cell wall biosynthesis